jgi:uncharacterized protein (DUF433 family)
VIMERITHNPEILGGKPIVRGTRISVAFILECLARTTITEVLDAYPCLSAEDIQDALLYAARAMHAERAEPGRPDGAR